MYFKYINIQYCNLNEVAISYEDLLHENCLLTNQLFYAFHKFEYLLDVDENLGVHIFELI